MKCFEGAPLASKVADVAQGVALQLDIDVVRRWGLYAIFR